MKFDDDKLDFGGLSVLTSPTCTFMLNQYKFSQLRTFQKSVIDNFIKINFFTEINFFNNKYELKC